MGAAADAVEESTPSGLPLSENAERRSFDVSSGVAGAGVIDSGAGVAAIRPSILAPLAYDVDSTPRERARSPFFLRCYFIVSYFLSLPCEFAPLTGDSLKTVSEIIHSSEILYMCFVLFFRELS